MTETATLAYRFEYADQSAFEVWDDGRAFITYPDGRREEKLGKITSNIRLLVGRAAKPRQDEIDRLRFRLSYMEQKYGKIDWDAAVPQADRGSSNG